MSKEMLIKISAEEYMRMKGIQMDSDEKDALALVKILLSRIEDEENHRMKSHLDQSRNL
jgi:hypothetical protein